MQNFKFKKSFYNVMSDMTDKRAGEIIAENPLVGMINYPKRENEKQTETGGRHGGRERYESLKAEAEAHSTLEP